MICCSGTSCVEQPAVLVRWHSWLFGGTPSAGIAAFIHAHCTLLLLLIFLLQVLMLIQQQSSWNFWGQVSGPGGWRLTWSFMVVHPSLTC